MEVDTGSAKTGCSKETWNKIKTGEKSLELKSSDTVLTTYTGEPIKPEETVKVP